MTGRQEYDRTKDRQRILDKYMIDDDHLEKLLNDIELKMEKNPMQLCCGSGSVRWYVFGLLSSSKNRSRTIFEKLAFVGVLIVKAENSWIQILWSEALRIRGSGSRTKIVTDPQQHCFTGWAAGVAGRLGLL
jgi:hypothetical protein